jgi:hypothetical protein
MNTLKNLQKFLTSKNVVFLVAVLVLSISLANYSFLKGMVVDGMTGGSYSLPSSGNPATGSHVLTNDGKLPQDYDDMNKPPVRNGNQSVEGATHDMMMSSPAPVSGMAGTTPSGNFSAVGVEDPSSLLPNDVNNEWAKLNPVGSHDLKNVSLLKAGYHIGIDTVGQSLRNANLQLRSEPPNPQFNVGPFNNTTIGPDLIRPTLEIGSNCM